MNGWKSARLASGLVKSNSDTNQFISAVVNKEPNQVMSVTKIALFLMAALSAVYSQSVAQIPQPSQPPYRINIAVLPSVAKAGSEVKLSITTKSDSPQVFYHVVTSGKPGWNLDIEIRDGKGDPVQESPNGRRLHATDPNREPSSGSVFAGRYPIKPGETFDETVSHSQEYDLSQPCTYSIQVLRSDITTVKNKAYKPISIKSNIIMLRVTPKVSMNAGQESLRCNIASVLFIIREMRREMRLVWRVIGLHRNWLTLFFDRLHLVQPQPVVYHLRDIRLKEFPGHGLSWWKP